LSTLPREIERAVGAPRKSEIPLGGIQTVNLGEITHSIEAGAFEGGESSSMLLTLVQNIAKLPNPIDVPSEPGIQRAAITTQIQLMALERRGLTTQIITPEKQFNGMDLTSPTHSSVLRLGWSGQVLVYREGTFFRGIPIRASEGGILVAVGYQGDPNNPQDTDQLTVINCDPKKMVLAVTGSPTTKI